MQNERSLYYGSVTAASRCRGKVGKDRTMGSLQKGLESRIDAIGWGVFFVMSGAMLLVPGLPAGSWVTGVGVILVTFSALRQSLGLPVSTFVVICGVVVMATGAGAMAGVAVPWFALLLVLCGGALVIDGLARRPQRA